MMCNEAHACSACIACFFVQEPGNAAAGVDLPPTLMLGASSTPADRDGVDAPRGGPTVVLPQQRRSVGGFGSVATSGVLDVLDRPGRSTAAVAAAAIAACEGASHGSGWRDRSAGRSRDRRTAAVDAPLNGRPGWVAEAAGTKGAKHAPARVAGVGFRVQSASAACAPNPAARKAAGGVQERTAARRAVSRAAQHDGGQGGDEDPGRDVMCDSATGVGMHVGHVLQQLKEGAADMPPALRSSRSARAPAGRIRPLLGSHKPDLR